MTVENFIPQVCMTLREVRIIYQKQGRWREENHAIAIQSDRVGTGSSSINVAVRATSTHNEMAVVAVPVYISARSKEKLVYALLDTQSDACFVSKFVADQISAQGEAENIKLHSLNVLKEKNTTRYKNLRLRGD